MALADAAASGDDDPLNEFTFEQAQMELNFRDAQLQQLREDVLDLDDLFRRCCHERLYARLLLRTVAKISRKK